MATGTRLFVMENELICFLSDCWLTYLMQGEIWL